MLETLILAVILLWFIVARQRANDRRFAALEAQVAELRAVLVATQPMPETAVVAEAETVAEEPVVEAQPLAIAASETAAPAAEPEPTQETSGDTLESWLGARWAVWVGGIALALGGIFLAKYSIESGLLSASVRLSLAALFGLVLFFAGEIVRRRALPQQPRAFSNALIPGVLTAAGAVTLFGTVYVAYAFYGFFGPVFAFALLAAVGLATLGLSLLHGQALAGLGLLGSMATPALIASTAPSIWALFSFLTFSWVTTALAARLRRWTLVPSLGNLGLCLWALAYIANATVLETVPPVLSLLCLIAGLVFLWPGTADFALPEPEPAAPAEDGATPAPRSRGPWESLLIRPPLGLTISGASAVLLPALALSATPAAATLDSILCFAVLIVTLAAWGATRLNAQWAVLLAATGAVGGVVLLALSGLMPFILDLPNVSAGTALSYTMEVAVSFGLGLAFVMLGLVFLVRHGRAQPQMATLWAASMAVVPVANGAVSLVNFGNLFRDPPHGLYGLAIAAILLGIAEMQSRRGETRSGAMHWLVGGGFFALLLALLALTNGIYTIIGVAMAGYAFVLAGRWRPWPALPWMMAVACITVLARIAVDPTIVGPDNLGTTPVFNALAIGYGLPAVLAALSAYHLRVWPNLRIRNLMQALASLMVFLTIAILLRHAMHGGRLASETPTLGEQSIYTLLTIGMAIVLTSLDFRSPSPVFRYGSIIVGSLSMLSILTTHLIVLNPYLTGEETGRWPFFNLLLLGYLLPGLAYGGLAAYARNRRPRAYVILASVSAAVLGFVWATLSVRRYWQGPVISDWKGFLESETYTYSVVWLLIGIGLLGLGSRFDAKSLRLASAALVMIAVLKVFLVDMANLEGVLRALSFIGLGIVLIGIGLFYQRILGNRGRAIASEHRGG